MIVMIAPDQTFLDDRIRLFHADCFDIVKQLADASIDAVVTDPPYAMASVQKRIGKPGSIPFKTGPAARSVAGFMGMQWDNGSVAFNPDFWREIYRVLKPGGHVAAFSGTRTYHRLAVAIEDSGFEIRDQLAWIYGTGFPKSHSMRDIGRPELGTALKPAWEPIVLARKPLIGTVASNVLEHGTGAINIDGCRVGEREKPKTTNPKHSGHTHTAYGKPSGGGNVLPPGRWPANLVHDGSDEVVALFPDSKSSPFYENKLDKAMYGGGIATRAAGGFADSGSAARFFYSAKADTDSRAGSNHPTVKPVDLMQWLARLVTPLGGIILDPFAGSGSTGEAAWREGFSAHLIEADAGYIRDIERRMALVKAGPATRAHEIVKARGKTQSPGGLFGPD